MTVSVASAAADRGYLRKMPVGTVIWTSPSGNTTTADLPTPTHEPPPLTADFGLMMPRRKRSRAADDAARIKAERALNETDTPPF
jgi:hypothetical protein